MLLALRVSQDREFAGRVLLGLDVLRWREGLSSRLWKDYGFLR